MKTYLALVIGAALAASNISNVEANTLLEFQKAVADGNTEIAWPGQVQTSMASSQK